MLRKSRASRRGTKSSNPVPSREESSANFLEPTFDRKEFTADVTRFCRDLGATEPVDPAQPVMMADDPQWNNAKKCMQEGIPVGPGLMNQVRQIAQACAAPWLLD